MDFIGEKKSGKKPCHFFSNYLIRDYGVVEVSVEPELVSVLEPEPAEPEPVVVDEPVVDPEKFLHSAAVVLLLQ